jgi:hypothetical protein
MGDHKLNPSDFCLSGWRYLILNDHSIPWILNHIDCFDRQTRLNESIKAVHFRWHTGNDRDDEIWDKVGKAIGNLQALERLSFQCFGQDGEDLATSAWEILARILRHVRQKITLSIDGLRRWNVEESRLFDRAIRGHPTITGFEHGKDFAYKSLDFMYSVVATLPALESIRLCGCNQVTTPEDESARAHPEILTELLRVPTLRSVSFDNFIFTLALCRATANALMEGTAITNLKLIGCSFIVEGCAAMMANGLKRNTSVLHIEVVTLRDQVVFDALATALPLNSTLRRLDLCSHESDNNTHSSLILLALGKNRGVKELSLKGFGSMDESLCTAMKDGLGKNTTLESLELNGVHPTDDDSDLWCRAFSFLYTNNTVKSLVVNLQMAVVESRAAAFRSDIVAMLQGNASLESLSILTYHALKADEYVELITMFQHNRTLKSLILQHHDLGSCPLIDDEEKEIAVILQKNYALEKLPDINLYNKARDVDAILRLNEAGRRYLVQEGSSISKGIEVLSRVNHDINCVYLHLLENPRLCDRSAVEIGSAGQSSCTSRNPISNDEGKRDQTGTHEGKQSRRRLA